MNPRALVQPLEPRWQSVVDAVLRPMRRPELTTKDVARLAPMTRELSLAYNTAQAEGRRTKLPLEARIAFSFPRDVPKGAAAVRELVASGSLTIPRDRPLRVLDLGAGLGAMTWGLVRALAASGASGRVKALLVDEDEAVLRKAVEIGRVARDVLGPSSIDLALETRTASLGSIGAPNSIVDSKQETSWSRELHDVVFLGQVLSELDPRLSPEARASGHAALIGRVLETMLAPDGALVIVEPALRERTRHLHAVRDLLLEKTSPTVFAPCLHAAKCPMLMLEAEWCHEDLPVDLPEWTIPLARAAGLRWQGLTFSYLVLRKDGRLPAPRLGHRDGQVRFRTVSDLLRSKGKIELVICGEDGARRRIRRLDRDADAQQGMPFLDLRRGDIVTLSRPATAEPPRDPMDERGRVLAGAHVEIDVGAARK